MPIRQSRLFANILPVGTLVDVHAPAWLRGRYRILGARLYQGRIVLVGKRLNLDGSESRTKPRYLDPSSVSVIQGDSHAPDPQHHPDP